MAKYNYAKKIEDSENTAKAVGRSLPISTKHCIEICNAIRNKPLQRAKNLMINVIAKKTPIPFKRFSSVGHKKGDLASGRYPTKACNEILKLLESAEKNAQFKGLNTADLVVSHICAQRAATSWHYGRQRRRKMKVTHVELVVKEGTEKAKAKKPEDKKVVAKKEEKEAPKKEAKPETQKESTKNTKEEAKK